ncbi:MAG: right-handed parallel beta-helix repeat-containing protein [Flavobacteriales bacterium]
MNPRRLFIPLVLLPLLAILFTDCQKDRFLAGKKGDFRISKDTVLFDTVFTTVNTVTKEFKIFNERSQALKIENITLAGGENSQYRINVDGQAGDHHEDVRIPGNDSIHVFVEARIDPTGSNNAMIVTDSVIVQSGDHRGKVNLAAWGQDAYFHKNVIYSCSGGPIVWSNDKPHVIYGTAAIDTNCTLEIEQGTQIHLHGNSRLVVLNNGKLDVQGTKAQKVVFQGDRLEPIYDDEPGQWERIWLIGNQGSRIEHAIIKNSVIGLQVDTVGTSGTPSVTILNTIIKDASSTGLLAQAGAHVVAQNSLFRDCGKFTAALTSGGRYEMTHCTFANYWEHGDRNDPSFVMSNYYEAADGQIVKRSIEQTNFTNCIFYGSRDEEFVVDTKSGPTLDYLFEYSLVKSKNAPSGSHYNQIFHNQDPGFKSTNGDKDYRLGAGAFPIDEGKTGTGVSEDLNENARDAQPDLGAYEK